VEVWQTSTLRPLRLGEERKKEEERRKKKEERRKKKPQDKSIMSASAAQAAITIQNTGECGGIRTCEAELSAG